MPAAPDLGAWKRFLDACAGDKLLRRQLSKGVLLSDDGRELTIRFSLSDLKPAEATVAGAHETIDAAAREAVGGPRRLRLVVQADRTAPGDKTGTKSGMQTDAGDPSVALNQKQRERLDHEHSEKLGRGIRDHVMRGHEAADSAAPAAARLIVIDGPDAGRAYPLAVRLATIGRGPDNTVFLPDPTVSKRHARIHVDGSIYELEDLGSRNGTRVNGKLVKGQQALSEGDTVFVGSTTLRFEKFGS